MICRYQEEKKEKTSKRNKRKKLSNEEVDDYDKCIDDLRLRVERLEERKVAIHKELLRRKETNHK